MKKIALIIPYIGKFPKTFDFWMKSVEWNPSIDFLLFTDNVISNPPDNLTVYQSTFKDLQVRFQKNFEFELCLDKAYKFCDFKPSYGEVFADYLQDYDFWGYTDMDLVYGDIRAFVTDELLNKYDRILGLGHFSLYRNNKDVNAIYRAVEIPNYKQVFTYSEGCAFDEYWGTSRYWNLYLHDRFYEAFIFDDIDCMLHNFESQKRRKEYQGCKNFIYAFENGILYRIFEKDGLVQKKKTMYVHFQKRDMAVETNASDKFLMIPNSYIEYENVITTERLYELGHRPNFYWQYYKLQWARVKNKYRKFTTQKFSKIFGKPKLPNSISYYHE